MVWLGAVNKTCDVRLVPEYMTSQTQATSDCNIVLYVDGSSPLAVKVKCAFSTFRENSTEGNTGSKRVLIVSWLEVHVRVTNIYIYICVCVCVCNPTRYTIFDD